MQGPGATGAGRAADPVRRARRLLTRVQEAADQGRPRVAVSLAKQALAVLAPLRDGQGGRRPDVAALEAQLSINLAVNLSELGRPDEALHTLDEAARFDPDQQPAVHTARAIHYARNGRTGRALTEFTAAIEGVPAAAGRTLAVALFQRSTLLMSMGRLREAQRDAERAAEVARELDNGLLTQMARHNLGYLQFLSGDLPRALAEMELASAALPDGYAAMGSLDRARVLQAAGLHHDAVEHARQAETLFRSGGAKVDLIDALMVCGDLYLLIDDPEGARAAFGQAAALSRARGHETLRAVAELGRFRASVTRQDTARRPADQARDAARLDAIGVTLREAGLPLDAASAFLLQADVRLEMGRIDDARASLESVTGLLTGRALGPRLHRRLVGGRLALAEGAPRRGLTELRKGLDELADFQARFGSQDMQSGSAVHGSQLAKLGLRTAIDTGSPALILQWLERARAVSTRLPVVHPPADAELAETLGALRFVSTQAREAALTGRPDPALQRKVAELRRQVRSRSWIVAGSGTVQPPLTLTAVQRLLAADATDPTIVAYITGQARVRALVITARRARYLELTEWDDESSRHRRRAADLDMLAAPRIPARIRQVARASLGEEFGRLAGELIEPIAGQLTDGPLIIAATGELSTVPWTLLPGLTGRPVSVAASVTSAMAAGGRPARAHLRGVLAVGGPEVENGAKEATEVAAMHPGAGLLIEEAATGEAVLAQIPAGGLLHIAAHGHHERESPLFSSVLLADGPLYGYDIAPNASLPDQVVLSSCDVGRSNIRPGGEPLGLAAALLRSGVSTVVAGVCRISDSVAAEVMAAYHRGLLAGEPPAAALAVAAFAVDGEIAPFTCFGSGT